MDDERVRLLLAIGLATVDAAHDDELDDLGIDPADREDIVAAGRQALA